MTFMFATTGVNINNLHMNAIGVRLSGLRRLAKYALSTSILSLLLNAPAWATNECGLDTPGATTLTCPGGTFTTLPGGQDSMVSYLSADDLTLDFNSATAFTPTAFTDAGVKIRNGDGNVTINALNGLSVSGATKGIALIHTGPTGNAAINVDGAIITTIRRINGLSPGNSNGYGLGIIITDTSNADGAISLSNSRISLNGAANSVGALVENRSATGNAHVAFNNVTYTSTGVASTALNSLIRNVNSTGDATAVLNGGSITTQAGINGFAAGGALAHNLGLGDATITANNTVVNVLGSQVNGLPGVDSKYSSPIGIAAVIGNAFFPNIPQNTGSTGTATAIVNHSTVNLGPTATSNGVAAVNWANGGSAATVTNTHITTTGLNSNGIVASTQRNNANNSNAVATMIGGSVTTGSRLDPLLGYNSAGVAGYSQGAGNGEVHVMEYVDGGGTAHGAVVTSNADGSSAVATRSRGATIVTVQGEDTVLTAFGFDSSGILSTQNASGAGSTFAVTVGTGVEVYGGAGAGSAGIRIKSQTGNTGTIDIAQGALIDGSTGAHGIWDEEGDATVTSYGEVRQGIATFGGVDVVNLLEHSLTTGGSGVPGVDTGEGNDTVNVKSFDPLAVATVEDGIITGLGDDIVNILDGSDVSGPANGDGINTGAGNDQVYVRSVDPSMFADISQGIATEDGDDIVRIEQNSRVTGGLNTGDGNDNVFVGTGATAVATSAVASLAGGIDTEDGDDTVRLANGSVVTGGLRTGTGDDIFSIGSSSTTVHTGLASLTGGIDAGDGDDVGELRDSSVVTGDIEMSGGNDALTITSGADITGVTLIDGGGNAAFNDGEEDILHLVGNLQTRRFQGSDLTNWETVNLANNADITFHGADLVTGSGAGTGFHNENAGLVVQSGSFARFDGDFTVDGDLTNRGTVDLRPDAALGTTLNVTGDYTGGSGSTLLMDVFLQDGLTDNNLSTDIGISDHLIVAGNGSGSTVVDFNNIGGPGALTDLNSNGVVDNNEGILFAQVQGGTSTANLFTLGTLSGTTIGAFTYDLVAFDPLTSASGSWDYVLANRFSNISEPYEVYPRAVMFTMPTLHQRVGNRHWDGLQPELPPEIFCKDPEQNYRCTITEEQASYYGEEKLIEENSAWVRIVGSHARIAPTLSTTGLVNYNIETVEIQAGIDRLLRESDEGNKWIGGLNAQISTAGVTGNDPSGDASMKATGLGIGATLTYYKPNGFYTDIQARLMAVSTDFSSTSGSYDNARAVVASASVEVGRKYEFGDGWRVVPQAQLTYTQARFRSFVDTVGTVVEPDNAESLKLRVGVNLGRERNWIADNGTVRRLEVEAGLNLHKELAGRTRVNVSGTPLYNEEESATVEVTLGATYNWNDDRNSVYGEVGVSTGLRNLGRSRRISGTIGYRRKWD
ncbi:autotransporter outer membrane beta-barrel domain-containing protein [Halocynthiibacter namhaensis]|uniref:autotransporter outer membrane beta-barrel domain-containing protein n=1 Tax=Halocynthiibacter namhaensis TaxID=1290553 RepID=UPI0005794F8B|nr:autotransporter outer membrane beta-barrel domain-containing protein [Halocynthiibacter namhaensis]